MGTKGGQQNDSMVWWEGECWGMTLLASMRPGLLSPLSVFHIVTDKLEHMEFSERRNTFDHSCTFKRRAMIE
jgi:hypothetical protein